MNHPRAAVMEYDMRFHLGRNCVVEGPSFCGKTYFVTQLIQHAESYFNPPPRQIFWHYGQVIPSERIPGVRYRQGIPTRCV